MGSRPSSAERWTTLLDSCKRRRSEGTSWLSWTMPKYWKMARALGGTLPRPSSSTPWPLTRVSPRRSSNSGSSTTPAAVSRRATRWPCSISSRRPPRATKGLGRFWTRSSWRRRPSGGRRRRGARRRLNSTWGWRMSAARGWPTTWRKASDTTDSPPTRAPRRRSTGWGWCTRGARGGCPRTRPRPRRGSRRPPIKATSARGANSKSSGNATTDRQRT
mmetsp:Transcript_13316/g.31498  ORF Transcript_13316/g.31498 Transcript_13316/m.31498 type:complete len:218 (-) Transcript_13316:267-920(-)